MFSWICPRCGRDNPPSAMVCLSCGARFDEEPEAAPPAAQAPSPETETLPTSPGSVSRNLSPPPTSVFRPPAARAGLPTWLLTVLFFFAIVGIGSGIFFGINYFNNRKQAASSGLDPAANAARAKLSNPLQKYVEVVGIRLLLDAKKKAQARFVVVNHSSNSLDDLSATVTLWASTARSEEDSVGTFAFRLPTLGPNESKELSAPLTTKLKFYELPDWQNATPDIQITSP